MLCVIDVFIKFVWTTPLNDKKGVTNVNALQKKIYKSNRKPVNFITILFNRGLVDNDIELYSTSNQGKSLVTARVNITLKCIQSIDIWL